MNVPQLKSLDQPEETRRFDRGHIELVTLGASTIARVTFEQGWRWSTCVKPLAQTDSCQATHLGYGVSGRIRVRMDDGSEFEAGPGDATLIPAGHDAWVVGDEPYVSIDFDPGNYPRAES